MLCSCCGPGTHPEGVRRERGTQELPRCLSPGDRWEGGQEAGSTEEGWAGWLLAASLCPSHLQGQGWGQGEAQGGPGGAQRP